MDEDRQSIRDRMRNGDMSVSNREVVDAFSIDPHYDPYSIPLDEMDPAHPALFAADTLWPHFERLRKEDPVHQTRNSTFGDYWSVTTYRDIMEVDSNHQVFSSLQSKGGVALGGVPDREDEYTMPMFIQEDPPKHDAQRKVVSPMFTPRNLLDLEPLIRERAGQILDGLPIGEEFNFVRDVSVELTGQMLATLFDVPQEDRHKLILWSDTIQNIGDPEYFETREDGFQVLFQCLAYFTEYFEARKKEPPKFDLISMLAHDEATRDMPPNELLGNIMLLIVGGNDTTRNSISRPTGSQRPIWTAPSSSITCWGWKWRRSARFFRYFGKPTAGRSGLSSCTSWSPRKNPGSSAASRASAIRPSSP